MRAEDGRRAVPVGQPVVETAGNAAGLRYRAPTTANAADEPGWRMAPVSHQFGSDFANLSKFPAIDVWLMSLDNVAARRPKEPIMADNHAPLGIAALDAQHEALVGMLGAFQLAVAARRQQDEINTIIEAALAAVRAHFQYEEALMVKSAYAATPEHHFEHERVMLFVATLTRDALEGRSTPEVLAENGELLRGLLRDHIASDDRALADHLHSLAAG